MDSITVTFTCESCGTILEAHVTPSDGVGSGSHKAMCPRCGTEQGSFSDKVIRVVDVAVAGERPEGKPDKT